MLVAASQLRHVTTGILHPAELLDATSGVKIEIIINRNTLLSFHDNKDLLRPGKRTRTTRAFPRIPLHFLKATIKRPLDLHRQDNRI
ncbi:hypothetical protein F2Q70_00035686 [Brassica cretica]|uniref:Uncharacterized protein n=1 Tax=Brassica cretica TaxID=69181 RepID=A0A8S9JR10_BRACR|nr:hypothetical protein F2Q70_00035686 [Brassica cretica]